MEIKCQSFWEMVDAIKEHCAKHGVTVLSNDDTEKLLVKFVTDCDEEDPRHVQWSLHVVKLKDVILQGKDREDADLADLLKSDRHALARKLSGSGHPWNN